MNKMLIGVFTILIVFVAFIGLILIADRRSYVDECENAIEPKLLTPVEVFDGAPYAVRICGVEKDHTYQLRENNYITTDIWMTGQTNYTIYRNAEESSFLDDGTLYLKLWDNTTNEIVDQNIIILYSNGCFSCEPIFLPLLAPLLTFMLVVGVITVIYQKIQEKRNKNQD